MPHFISLLTLAQLSGLKLRSRHVVEGLLVGEHRGAGQGLAVEFAQLRPYAPGDELRRIDWKVYARTDKLHVRQYEEEVDLSVYLLLDASAGMGYKGTQSAMSKFEYAQILAGVNAYLTLRQNDTCHWAVTGKDLTFGNSTRGLGQWTTLLDSIDETSVQNQLPMGNAPISVAIRQALLQWRKRGLVLIFSDGFDKPESIESALKQLYAVGHDCRFYHVLDRDEITFPFNRRTRFVDMETGGLELDTEPEQLRQAYLEIVNRQCQHIQHICTELEMDYRLAVTDSPIEQILRGGQSS